ncbi:MAG TPA: serine--tRNA ligase [Acidimicrobiales bacterium]|nr:serine--tRNA ligase [Acidimicrobiales bacterium]
MTILVAATGRSVAAHDGAITLTELRAGRREPRGSWAPPRTKGPVALAAYPCGVIDLALLRRDPTAVRAALARRGVDPSVVDALVELDAEHRIRLQYAEELRAEVKGLSRQVAAARKAGDTSLAEEMQLKSRSLGYDERRATAEAETVADEVRRELLVLPNLPDEQAPDGASEADNVEVARWWPGIDDGHDAPAYGDHQRVAHWDIGASLGILDFERGARLSGSMFPLFTGWGSRLLRALSAYSLDQHVGVYTEVRPPTLVLTEAMTASGHLPKFVDEAYAVERDGLWAIPTAEVPLTSMHRGELLDESVLPLRYCATTPCFRREAGAAGKDTRGLLRVHEFDKTELFAYCTSAQAPGVVADIRGRGEAVLRAFGLQYRVLDLCVGDLGLQNARTFDLEVFAPGADRWLEVSSISWYRDYQARRANVRYRPTDGGSPLVAHTVNGSVLGWARVFAALVETQRQADGSVVVPEVLVRYVGTDRVATKG